MRRMLAAELMVIVTAACGETLEPVAAELDCEMNVKQTAHFDFMRPDFAGYSTPQEAIKTLIANNTLDIGGSLPDGTGDFEIHPAADRPTEGMIADDAEIWVVVGETGDRVLIAGVNPAPGDPGGYIVKNVELCGPNFVDNP